MSRRRVLYLAHQQTHVAFSIVYYVGTQKNTHFEQILLFKLTIFKKTVCRGDVMSSRCGDPWHACWSNVLRKFESVATVDAVVMTANCCQTTTISSQIGCHLKAHNCNKF